MDVRISMSLNISSDVLHALAEKWNEEWKNGYFNQFRAVGENTFQFKINTKKEKVSLLIKLPSLIWESQRKWEVLEEQPPIVNKTKSFFENQKILSVSQHENDRIVVVECSDIVLIVELFGGGNIIVTDKSNKILAVWEAREWKGRTLKHGFAYLFPQASPARAAIEPEQVGLTAAEIEKLFEELEAQAMQNEPEKEKPETKNQMQVKALKINLERQQSQMRAWEEDANALKEKGEWVYAHFTEVEQVIQALQRAKKQKLNEKLVLRELQKKFQGIIHLDMEKMQVEWETE